MTSQEYETLTAQDRTAPQDQKLKLSDLTNKSERTLIYGYTLERDTIHVYIKDGKLHWVMYTHSKVLKDHLVGDELPVRKIIPNKRAYPARSDFETANLIKQMDVYISWTTFTEDTKTDPQKYEGKTFEELLPPETPVFYSIECFQTNRGKTHVVTLEKETTRKETTNWKTAILNGKTFQIDGVELPDMPTFSTDTRIGLIGKFLD